MADDNPTRRLGIGMTIAMWLVLLALLTFFFQRWDERRNNPNMSPVSRVTDTGVRELVLKRNYAGHYVASGSIDGQAVVFMLDTGASDIAIPAELADRLALQRGPAQVYRTANGPVKVFATRLDRVAIGAITLHDVRASINPAMHNQEVLLGMSFLKHLEFSQRGDRLTLRQYVTP